MPFESRILKRKLGVARKKKIVLFLCTGDTCRNPMAAGYLEKIAEDAGIKELDVRTAGVMTVPGLLPSDESVEMLNEHDVDIRNHRSRPLTPELIRRVDLVLGMTPIHVQTALRMCEEAKGKTFLLRDYSDTAEGKNSQVNDPMGCTLEVYKNCFKLIKKACEGLLKRPFFQEMLPKKTRAKSEKKKTTANTARKSKAATKKTDTSKTTKSAQRKTSSKKAAKKSTSSRQSGKSPKSSGSRGKSTGKTAKKSSRSATKSRSGKSAKSRSSKKKSARK